MKDRQSKRRAQTHDCPRDFGFEKSNLRRSAQPPSIFIRLLWLSAIAFSLFATAAHAQTNPRGFPGSLATALDTIGNTMDVVYIGTDQHVHQLWYNGFWHRNDLTITTGALNAAFNSPVITAVNTFANTMEVDYLGTDGHVHQLWYDGFWFTQDLTAVAAAPNAISGSLVTTAADTIGNTMDVEYIGTDQHVHQLWYSAGIWRHNDLTATTGAANASSNGGLVTNVNTFANTMEVDYLGTDGHVHQLWYNGFWHTQDLTAAAAAPIAVSGSPITSAVDSIGNTMDVEYIGTDQHVHQLWYSTGIWYTTDLTAVSGH